MIRPTHWLTLLAGILPTAAWAQTPPPAQPLRATAVRNFAPQEYHADRQNWAITEDSRGILFFGNSTGVLEFDGTRWRRIEMPKGRGAFALGKAADGRVLVGGQAEKGWLAPDRNGLMTYVPKLAGLPDAFLSSDDRVFQIIDTPTGRAFLSDHWLFVTTPTGAELTAIQSVDHFMRGAWFNGAMYILDSARGLTRLVNRSLRDVPGGAPLRGLAMLVTDAGLIIPTLSNGLVRYAPAAKNPWQYLNTGGWGPTDGTDVTCGVVLSPNLIALGTQRNGVIMLDAQGNILTRVTVADGLAAAHVYSIDYDRRGGLWLALDNGLSLVSLNLARSAAAVPFRAWVRRVEGTRDDRLLFGGTYSPTPGGLQQLQQAEWQKLQFPFKYNAFRFEYSANGLEASGEMQFQTFMQGVDSGWSGWSTRTEREFTQLNRGQWIFRVRSRAANGEVSGEGSYEMLIKPAWYDTWWFTVFQILFVFALLVLPGEAQTMKGLQESLTTLAVIVPFVYIGDWLGGFVDHYYSSDIAFVKMLMSALLAFLLDPIQGYLKKYVERRNEKRREAREHRMAPM